MFKATRIGSRNIINRTTRRNGSVSLLSIRGYGIRFVHAVRLSPNWSPVGGCHDSGPSKSRATDVTRGTRWVQSQKERSSFRGGIIIRGVKLNWRRKRGPIMDRFKTGVYAVARRHDAVIWTQDAHFAGRLNVRFKPRAKRP
jgi:hypothetical protein